MSDFGKGEEFERLIKEYRAVVNKLKRDAIRKYGIKARRWFP